jgi:hypothetical protein
VFGWSSVTLRFSLGATTKNNARANIAPIADRAGATKDTVLTPSTSLNQVKAEIVIPKTAAAVRLTA